MAEMTLHHMADSYGVGFELRRLLAHGGTFEQAKKLVVDAVLECHRGHSSGGFVDALSYQDRDEYLLTDAINYLIVKAEGNNPDKILPVELSDEIARQVGRTANGLFVPMRLYNAGLSTATSAGGGYTNQMAVGDLISYLRAKLKVQRLGATVLTDLRDSITFPVEASITAASWAAENGGVDILDSDESFGARTMVPHGLCATTSISRQLLGQSSLDVEAFIRQALALAHAAAIDKAAASGTGTQNQPTGILNAANIGSVIGGTNGAVITNAHMSDLAGAIFNSSGDGDFPGYLTTPGVRNKLVKTGSLDQAGSGIPVWTVDSNGVGRVGGFRAEASAQIPSTISKGTSNGNCHAVIFSGDWSDLVIGIWEYAAIEVDPFRLKKQNLVEITAWTYADVLVRHAGCFSAMSDALIA